MNRLHNLIFGGGKSLNLLFLLFLLLGNTGAWAQAEPTVTNVATFKSADLITDQGYADTYGGEDWYINMGGNNKSIGFNNKNCVTITDNLGTSAVTTNNGIVVKSKKSLSNVNRITFVYTGGSGDGGKIYLASSTDNVTWTALTLATGEGLSAQGTTVSQNTTFTFEFDKQDAAYYGIILDKGDAKKAAYRFDNVVITFDNVETSTGPSITAQDVNYAADIISGEIPYTINNPVEGTQLTASTTAEWISDVAVDAANSKVTFSMTENTETTPRTGTVTLAYGTDITKDVTVTQAAAVAKRTVAIETPENGTLKVLRDGAEVASGDKIPQGVELTMEAKPDAGYKLRNIQAVDASTHTYTKNFTYTIGESDVTFKANFDLIVYNTVTWSVNGVETTEQVEEGTAITFATPTENIPEGYVFKGWYSSTLEPQDVAPEFVTSATAAGDVTYYAVFAKSNGGGTETATLKTTHTKADTAYKNHTYTDDKGNTWNAYNTELINGSDAIFGLNSGSGRHFESPTFAGNITKIVMSIYNTSSSSRTYYINSSKGESKTGDLGTLAAPGSTKTLPAGDVVLTGKEFNKFFIETSAALGFSYIEVTYTSEVFTDYRTSVTAAETATITIAEACTDGEMYYSTYSSSKPFVVSEDIIVSEISIVDNQLLVETYVTGTVVPANTGVMVSSMTAGAHEVLLSGEAGTSVLGADNMLRPSGEAGITADGMAAADAGCKYFRLTMHKGTQIGFYWGAPEGAAFNLAANKAYLAVPAAVAAKIAGFDLNGGGTTAIDGIENGAKDNGERKIYNMQGQRVAEPLARGLYVIDGRKVIVK